MQYCRKMDKTTAARIIVLLALLVGGKPAVTQPARYYFDHLTTREGLSQNDVNCILRDTTGFMWFGTNDGLNLYDGYEFTVYKPVPGDSSTLISNLVMVLEEDHLGWIWVGTTGEGLSCFLPKYKRFVNFKELAAPGLELGDDVIKVLHVDKKNRLWVGTTNGNTVFQLSDEYEISKNSVRNISDQVLPAQLKHVKLQGVLEEDPQNIWLASQAGLFKLSENAEKELVQVVPRPVRGIAMGRQGELIVGAPDGLIQLRKNPHGPYISQWIDHGLHDEILYSAGAVWTSSPNGLTKFVYEADTSLRLIKEHTYTSDLSDFHSLSKTVLRTIYADHHGLIWIGTNGGGINKFEPKQKTFFHYKETLAKGSLGYDKVRSLYEDSYQNLWVGTEGGGVNFLPAADSATNSYKNFSCLPQPSYVFALTEYEKQGERYVILGGQTQPGLYQVRIKPGMKHLKKEANHRISGFSGAVFALLNTDNRGVWVGTYHDGLYYLDLLEPGVKRHFLHRPEDPASLSSNLVRSLMQDKEGNVWIGTGNGLNRLAVAELEHPRPTFVSFMHDPADAMSISHDYILALFQSTSGDIWVGTFGGGLNKFVPPAEGKKAYFVAYTEADGLPNNVVKGILEDEEGFLWLSTNKGLTRFNPLTDTFQNFDTRDGLQSDEFSELAQLKRKNGEMIFGGVNGFNVFKPSSIHINPHTPQVVLTEFQVLNKTVRVGEEFNDRILLKKAIFQTDKIQLKHHENSFSLGFSAFHYLAPIKNKYAFMLEGFHDDWVYVGANKRFVNFTNLDPGTYVFKVKASNSGGVWNEQPTQITIQIAPPFWMTWWAFLLYAILLVGMIWILARYSLIDIRQKHQLMLEHLEKEKNEELQQMKLQFFTNISHELRTPLSLISGPIDHLLQSGKSLSYDKREKQYQLIRKNAAYLLRLANQILDFRKIDQGIVKLQVQNRDLVHYIEELAEPFQFIANEKGISFEINASHREIFTCFDPGIMEKTLYNLLSNAFKNTPEDGMIRLEVRQKKGVDAKTTIAGDRVEIRVRDTGVGVSRKERKRIFHRFYKGMEILQNNTPGVGIGLSYTEELVKLHHGAIWVEENQPKGACFVVVLPQEENAYHSHEMASANSSGRGFHNDSHSVSVQEMLENIREIEVQKHSGLQRVDERIAGTSLDQRPSMLIIDDHAGIRMFLKEAFRESYRLLEAADGQAGWELALKHSPDLVISDVMMPYKNGIELCRELKEDVRTSHIPVILLTAKTTEESELEGLKNRADAYIRKPFTLERLSYTMHNILSTREEMRNRFRLEKMMEPEAVTVTSADELFLKKAMQLVEENMMEPSFSVEVMVREMGMSRSKLYLKLKALTGQSSGEFIRVIRLKRAVQLLEKTDYTIKEIMYMTGFNTASYFSKCFKKQFGLVPSEYMRLNNTAMKKA